MSAAEPMRYLERRLENVEDELEPLKAIPALVAQHEGRLQRMREDAIRADELEQRRVDAIHRRFDQFEAKVTERFDKVDRDHAAARTELGKLPSRVNGTNWPAFITTLIAAGAGIGAPIAAAIIAASG